MVRSLIATDTAARMSGRRSERRERAAARAGADPHRPPTNQVRWGSRPWCLAACRVVLRRPTRAVKRACALSPAGSAIPENPQSRLPGGPRNAHAGRALGGHGQPGARLQPTSVAPSVESVRAADVRSDHGTRSAPLSPEIGPAGRLQILTTEHWSLLATRSPRRSSSPAFP